MERKFLLEFDKKNIQDTMYNKEKIRFDSIEIEFKDEESKAKWEEFIEVNSNDDITNDVIEYATIWAKLMQIEIHKDKEVSDIATNTSYRAEKMVNKDIYDFKHGFAVHCLSRWWKYGEELFEWNERFCEDKNYDFSKLHVSNIG